MAVSPNKVTIKTYTAFGSILSSYFKYLPGSCCMMYVQIVALLGSLCCLLIYYLVIMYSRLFVMRWLLLWLYRRANFLTRIKVLCGVINYRCHHVSSIYIYMNEWNSLISVNIVLLLRRDAMMQPLLVHNILRNGHCVQFLFPISFYGKHYSL